MTSFTANLTFKRYRRDSRGKMKLKRNPVKRSLFSTFRMKINKIIMWRGLLSDSRTMPKFQYAIMYGPDGNPIDAWDLYAKRMQDSGEEKFETQHVKVSSIPLLYLK